MKASLHKFSQKVLGETGLRIVSTVFVLLLARTLGAEEFGRYSTAVAYAALCIIFVDLGTNSILTRDIARDLTHRTSIAQSSHFLKMAASAAAWLILLALTYILHFPTEQRYLTLCLGVVAIGQTLNEYFGSLLSGIEEMGWEASLKVLSRTLGLSWGFVSLALKDPLPTIVTHMAIGTVAGYAVSVFIVKNRFGVFGIKLDPVFLRNLLATSWPLFGSVIFWILYDSQDVLLLNYFHFPPRDIGLFSAAMKIIDVTRVYPVLMMGVFFPTLSKLHLSSFEEFRKKKRRLILAMGVSMTLLAAVTYGLAPWIIGLLYKQAFMPSAHLLRLLTPALFMMGVNHTQMQFLIAVNRERKLLASALTACSVNVFLAWLLLPRFGVPGTCYALLGSEMVNFLFLRRAMTSKS